MNQSKPRVILTRKLPETVETRMRELFSTSLNETDMAFSRAQLEDAVKTADVLVPTVTDKIDADLIAAAGNQISIDFIRDCRHQHISRLNCIFKLGTA